MSTLDLFSQDEQSPFDAISAVRADGTVFWDARRLMAVMAYGTWERFKNPLARAMTSAANQGVDIDRDFRRSAKNSGTKPMESFELSRFGAYLVAMNGDPRKPEVAAAQAYFAIRTREAEVAPKPLVLTEDEIVAQALAITTRKVEALAERVAVLEPKAEYVDTFVTDEDVLSFSTVASTLDMQVSKLREVLIDHGWVFKETATRWSNSKGRKEDVNRYTEYAHKKLYFRRIEEHQAPRFRGEVMHTLKITPSGAHAIARAVARWANEGRGAA